jgi:hypothetical protein
VGGEAAGDGAARVQAYASGIRKLLRAFGDELALRGSALAIDWTSIRGGRAAF